MARYIAYTRVSTTHQDASGQRLKILEWASRQKIVIDEIVEETISSRKADREIFRLIQRLEKGDTIIVTELSRLCRGGTIEMYGILSQLAEKKTKLIFFNGDIPTTVDPTNPNDIPSQALVFAFSISAQVERNAISERTKAGQRARVEQGVKLGRKSRFGKSKLDQHAGEIRNLLNYGVPIARIAKIFKVNRMTMKNWLHWEPQRLASEANAAEKDVA